jgi:hypothetical protein
MATSTDPARVQLTAARGSDFVIRGTLGSSVAGHTYALYITRVGSDTAIVTKTPSVVTEATGVMDATIAKADIDTELTVGETYEWDWWRIDTGNQRRVGWGPLLATKGKPA